ncbi:ankyrin repeat-containing domain protein, partial [Colletotrichum navitas]
ASARGHKTIINLLLKHHANVDLSDVNDVSPLDVAIAGGHGIIAKKLINSGALAKDSVGLHFAVRKGNTDMIQLLLAHGWNPNALYSINRTPLHLAIDKGCKDIVSILLQNEASASVNALNSLSQSPLHNAIALGHTEMVIVVLEGGADVNLCTENGQPALHITLAKITGIRGRQESSAACLIVMLTQHLYRRGAAYRMI